MGFRVSQSTFKDPAEQRLRGVPRLVNPRGDDAEVLSGEEEDEGERDYVGHILHVADEALRHVKHRILRHTRRGRIY